MDDAIGGDREQASRLSSPYKNAILADCPVYFKPPVFGKGNHQPNS